MSVRSLASLRYDRQRGLTMLAPTPSAPHTADRTPAARPSREARPALRLVDTPRSTPNSDSSSVRWDKVALARQRLAAGAYDEPAILDQALTKLLDDLPHT